MTTAIPWYLDTLPKGYAAAGRWRDGAAGATSSFTPAQAAFASVVEVNYQPYTNLDPFECAWAHARYGDSGDSASNPVGAEDLVETDYTTCPALGTAAFYWKGGLPFLYDGKPYVGDHSEVVLLNPPLWEGFFCVVLDEVNVGATVSNNLVRQALPDPPDGYDILVEKESADSWLADRLDLTLNAQLFAHHNYEQAYQAFDSAPFNVRVKAETDVRISSPNNRPPGGYLSSWSTDASFDVNSTSQVDHSLTFGIAQALASPAQWQIMFASDAAIDDVLSYDPPAVNQWIRSAYLNPTAVVAFTTPRYRFVRKGSPPLRQRQNARGSLGSPSLRSATHPVFPPLRLRQDGAR